MPFFRPLLLLIFLGVPAVSPAQPGLEGTVKVVEPATPGLRKITHVEPVYPEQARQARIQGLVSVQITVGTDGRVSGARLGATIPMLGQAVLDAVKQWVYDPATIKTPVTLTVSVLFSAATAAPAVAPPTSEGSPPALSATATTQGAPTTPLTTRHGFTVDVPADWKRYESGGWQHAVSSDGQARVAIADDSGSLQAILSASEPHLESIAHGEGRIFYRPLGQPGGYVIYVQLNKLVTLINCQEKKGAEGGASGCLTIAKTARFTSASPPSAVVAAPRNPTAAAKPETEPPARATPTAPEARRTSTPDAGASTAPAPGPRPTPKPSPSQPGHAERERPRLQQENERIDEISARINRRNEISIAVLRETQARLQACIELAKKAHPDQASPANQQAVKACNDRASRGGACVQQADQARLDPLTPEYQKAVDTCFQAAWESGPHRSQDVPPRDGSLSTAAPSPPAAARGITGCWVYNNTINLTIFEDGRITGFLDGGKWSRIGDNRFLFTGPPSTDTLVLSDDGGILSGSNNYWGPLSAQRSSGTAQSVVGAWKWPNGATTVLSEGGEAQNGPLSGKWTQQRGNAIRIVWNFFFTDDVTLSPDGQSLSGKNMQGMPVGGRRVPCSK